MMTTKTSTDSAIIAAYLKRIPKSVTLAAKAKKCFPSGVTHDGRYLQPHGIYVTRAAGSQKWDVDGNQYVDYSGGHGALLLGHNHPQVVEAVAKQIKLGTHFGAGTELEIRWAEMVQHLIPSAQRVRFTSSGTEATLLCMRLARAFTGKNKVVRFTGHFHGWHDHVAFGVASHFDRTVPAGVVPGIVDEVLLATPNDVDATQKLLDQHDDIAMVIIEPTGASWGMVPVSPDFLSALRRMTSDRNILLVFDEVISGFRVSPGGAQAELGITADLTTLAKILAGGLPGGALVGRKDIMDLIDHAAARQSGRERIVHHGTFNANPLSAAAGIAALDLIANSDACQKANQYAEKLRHGLNDVLTRENVNWAVYGSYSSFHIFTNPKNQSISPADLDNCKHDWQTIKGDRDNQLVLKLRIAMLLHGVEIFAWPGGPTSAVHTEDDLSRTCEAFAASLKMLKDEGDID